MMESCDLLTHTDGHSLFSLGYGLSVMSQIGIFKPFDLNVGTTKGPGTFTRSSLWC